MKRNIDDWVLEAEDKSFIHFEFQTTLNENDLKRFMVSDAILCYKKGRPVKTVVVYTGNIEKAKTELDFDSIRYNVDAFYLAKLDGDARYDELRKKVEAGRKLAKQDLMSIVFLPLMKNSIDKDERFEQAIYLSREIKGIYEQMQIQAMISILVEKFVTDKEKLNKLKEVLNMTAIAQMIRDDAINDYKIEIAKNALKKGADIDFIRDITGLKTKKIKELQAELNNE
ncbi:MAG: hypothetical protein LBI54_10740 [Lachnospiraceae bacterium]|nr:hypothetical protein [Lachnospiraceae bacterium]